MELGKICRWRTTNWKKPMAARWCRSPWKAVPGAGSPGETRRCQQRERLVDRPELRPLLENLDVGDEMFYIMRRHLSLGLTCVDGYLETLHISYLSHLCHRIFCLLKSNCGDCVSPLFRINLRDLQEFWDRRIFYDSAIVFETEFLGNL